MVDSREAFYSTNVVMEVDAILYLNYTQDLKKKVASYFKNGAPVCCCAVVRAAIIIFDYIVLKQSQFCCQFYQSYLRHEAREPRAPRAPRVPRVPLH